MQEKDRARFAQMKKGVEEALLLSGYSPQQVDDGKWAAKLHRSGLTMIVCLDGPDKLKLVVIFASGQTTKGPAWMNDWISQGEN